VLLIYFESSISLFPLRTIHVNVFIQSLPTIQR
jgi:hypothetical protein